MITRKPFALMAVGLLLCGGAALAQTCIAPPSGMIAWWTLDETSGIVAKDSVGTEPAAYFGVPAPIQTPGEVAGALQFNGSTDFLSAADSNIWDFGASNFTIEFWVNFGTPGGGTIYHPSHIFIGHDEGPGIVPKWFVALGGGQLEFVFDNLQHFLLFGAFSPNVHQWYHLAVTRNGSLWTAYVNGAPFGSPVTDAATLSKASAPLTIGQAESLGFVSGLLDEISVYNRALSQAELQAIANAGSAGKCKLPTTTAVSPSVGGDAGQVTVTLSGSLFLPTSTVSLSAPGFPSINGSTPIVSPDGSFLTTTFDLTGQPDGVWDVVVSGPGLPTVTLPQSFTIEPATPQGQVWANVVGRGAIRVGETQEFTLLYGNNSDTDAICVPILLAGIPTTATFTPQFVLTQPPTVAGWPPFDSSSPITFTTAIDIEVPLIIGRIPPGTVGSLSFSLLVVNTTPIVLVATASQPLVSFVAATSAVVEADLISPNRQFETASHSRLAAAGAFGSTLLLNPQALQCFTQGCQYVLGLLGITPTLSCLTTGAGYVVSFFRTVAGAQPATNPLQLVVPFISVQTGFVQTVLNCVGALSPELQVVKAALMYFSQTVKGWGIGTACGAAFAPYFFSQLSVAAVNSYDPNAKFGSQGVGALQYLAGSAPWPYTIAFENDATATAPAQSVSVSDQLDITNLDLNTFSLGPIGFGNQEVVPPPGLSQFSTYVDLRPATSLLVAVSASLNRTSGIVTWNFSSIDPSTGQVPTNPLVGFLPPDVVPPEGDGQVLFSVSPKNSLSTGQQINNSASVVFDVNPPVVTPAWSNTLDNSPPVSNVLPLPAQSTANFTVSWQGGDVGSGVKDYTIYVSDNGGPFTAWLTYTTATEAIYPGSPGNAYGFYSIARDLTNNMENSKARAAASTVVTGPVPSGEILVTASGLAYSRVSQTFNGSVTIKNVSSSAISGPFEIVFTGLPTGVSLVNPSGTYNGSQYLTVPSVASFAVGQSATVSVQFKNPSNGIINFTPVIYSGGLN